MPHAPHRSLPERTFTLSSDGTEMPLVITQQALDEFELQGLATMDDCLIQLIERMTPANAPEMCPNPLDLIGQMLMDGIAKGNTRKIMLCALWLGHHYPSVTGMVSSGQTFAFLQRNTQTA